MLDEVAGSRGAATAISVFDLFTIGVGPSSSHTVGPMRAAFAFGACVAEDGRQPVSITCHLYGSLALTGRGHATDRAVILGLMGWEPEKVDPHAIDRLIDDVAETRTLAVAGKYPVAFEPGEDIVWHTKTFLPEHSNGMTMAARFADGEVLEQTYFSIGGGAILRAGQEPLRVNVQVPLPYESAAELLEIGEREGMSIADIVRRNEAAWRPAAETDQFLLDVHQAMEDCIARGIATEGILPGGLKVPRRAYGLHRSLMQRGPRVDPSAVFEWVSLWALAVNEENAGGGRVVTAPTNGAAGVIPAVTRYYSTFVHGATGKGVLDLLYTSAAIGFLYKKRASISAAEMGCQGEVGVACSMAAGGLVAALGGTNRQIENAAEIGMEHNLGLTCDPVKGLVQVPCIERNTMGAIKAINAAYLALAGDGVHLVSLDAVIETMRQTGVDMKKSYKETSLGGLAVNVVEC